MNDISILLWKEWRGNAHLLVLQAAALLLPVVLVFGLVISKSDVDAPFLNCWLSVWFTVRLLG